MTTSSDDTPRIIEPKGGGQKGRVSLSFEGGTIVASGIPAETGVSLLDGKLVFDDRIERWRAHAYHYRHVVAGLVRLGYEVEDGARAYEDVDLSLVDPHDPYTHQAEAIEAWRSSGSRGVVILPTGAGKTFVAQLAIAQIKRTALVVVPTLDLLSQWAGVLSKGFGVPIGMLGGGYHEIEQITVSTYDSAHIHMDRIGARFGLVIFDEVHHLPGALYIQAAHSTIAPFRLGLTATYERSDGRQTELDDAVGPVVFRRSIKELSGDILADYEVRTVRVEMTPEDFETYTEAREFYRTFVSVRGIRMSSVNGWKRFLSETSRSKEGRQALELYHVQKRLALVHTNKLKALYGLLKTHHDDRVLIFTNDNASVYEISERMLCPSITHQTPIKERKEILARFNEGSYRTIVTSKVLNEGVDVPEANVAIILSGSGSVREHVQRLGRILRRAPNKKALLYELVTDDTVETYVSQRRREHDAYQ